jgi:hypothetical protein
MPTPQGTRFGRNCVKLTPQGTRFASTTSKPYYEIIADLKYDRAALDAARAAVAGAGDGRVSMNDAKFILSTLLDTGGSSSGGGSITTVEYRTAFMILRDFNFTSEARNVFVDVLASS